MPDTNEERLLSELLRDTANADAGLAGSEELERRVMAAWDTRESQSPGSGRPGLNARWTIANHPWAASLSAAAFGAAALGAAALVLALTAVMQLGVTTDTRRMEPVERRPEIIAPIPQPTGAIDKAVAVPAKVLASVAPRPRRRAGPQNEIVSFIPLVPMTADELSGSFSIARVQIGQTEADVLLGEDGMARAIRVSTNGSAPGRLR